MPEPQSSAYIAMAGLDPAIPSGQRRSLDARLKAGHGKPKLETKGEK
jgi:hypothetical protein